MSPQTLQIHAGEGQPATGCTEALSHTTLDPEQAKKGGVVDVGATIAEAVSVGSMGLKGWLNQIGNATAMVVICAIVGYGMVFVIPETRKEFNNIITAERESNERAQKLDREMYDRHRETIEDRADARMERFGSRLRQDIKDAVTEAMGHKP